MSWGVGNSSWQCWAALLSTALWPDLEAAVVSSAHDWGLQHGRLEYDSAKAVTPLALQSGCTCISFYTMVAMAQGPHAEVWARQTWPNHHADWPCNRLTAPSPPCIQTSMLNSTNRFFLLSSSRTRPSSIRASPFIYSSWVIKHHLPNHALTHSVLLYPRPKPFPMHPCMHPSSQPAIHPSMHAQSIAQVIKLRGPQVLALVTATATCQHLLVIESSSSTVTYPSRMRS